MLNQREAALDAWLKKIAKIKPLSTKEEHALAARIRLGDKKALSRLTEANFKFVVSVAHNYMNQGVPLMDLINEGNLGLVKAARLFDETRNYRFNSYAVWWIRQRILRLLAEQSRFVRVPINNIKNLQKISKLQKSSNDRLSSDEIARKLGIDVETVKILLYTNAPVISLDAKIDSNDGQTTVSDFIADNSINIDDDVNEQHKHEIAKQMLNFLDDRSRNIVMLYYGLKSDLKSDTDSFELSLQEIANRYNISRERVRQIKYFAIRRLRKIINYLNRNLKPSKECAYGEEKYAAECRRSR